jgi:hypothetical protein
MWHDVTGCPASVPLLASRTLVAGDASLGTGTAGTEVGLAPARHRNAGAGDFGWTVTSAGQRAQPSFELGDTGTAQLW